MEVRIAKLATLLNRTVEGNAKTNTNSDNSGEEFKHSVTNATVESETDRQENNEIDSHTVYVSLSSKGYRHSSKLFALETVDGNDEDEMDVADGKSIHSISFAQMSDKLQGLSDKVINGDLSATDKMNFDAELKALMSLLDYADNESKCEMISERINDLTILINDATVYRNNHLAIFKLIDPDYDKD